MFCFGNFLKSKLWSESTPYSQVVTCEVEFHVNSNSSCASAYFPARCTTCPVVWVCHTPLSARLLTHPDDSSTSALSQLKTFVHPISQQFRISMKKFTLWRSCADSWDALNTASLYNINRDGAHDGQQRSLEDFQFDLEKVLAESQLVGKSSRRAQHGLGDAGHPCQCQEPDCSQRLG